MLRTNSHRLNTELGYYTPSAFQVKYFQEGYIVNTDYEYILFHEYIHFLQDISTNYGKTNLCNYYSFLIDIILELQSKSDAFTINLPLQFTKAPLLLEHNLSTSIVLGNTENINSLANQSSSSISAEIHKKPIELYNL